MIIKKIEIKPVKNKIDKFINIKQGDEKYYHIYINNGKKEIKRNYINKDVITEIIIKIIIDYQIKSFKDLFSYCNCIESIYFKKFFRTNITNMSYMFYRCSSLKELNLNNFNINNVTEMFCMFDGCSNEVILKIKTQYKNIKKEAFKKY